MKFSTLGLIITASSLVGVAAIVQPSSAATINASDITNPSLTSSSAYTFDGTWEFKYITSIGGYRSKFGVTSTPNAIGTTLFTEGTNQNFPGNAAPSTATYTFASGSALAQFFLTNAGNGTPNPIFSGVPIPNNTANFFIAKAGDVYNSGVLNDPNDVFTFSTDGPYNSAAGNAYQIAINKLAASGYLYAIGVNDQGSGDRDNQDFVVYAKPVPVPAIVPGIALAAAFFGSKALKRNKKTATETVV